MAELIEYRRTKIITGDEVQPAHVDLGTLPATERREAIVYVEFSGLINFWGMSPADARQIAAALEALALEAEGRKPS